VNAVDKDRLKDQVGPGRRFPFGLPRTDNANYLWIQLFASVAERQRPRWIRHGQLRIRSARVRAGNPAESSIESRAVDVMVAVGPNMFLYGHAPMHAVVLR
jgi:type I restriction enzyme M protein